MYLTLKYTNETDGLNVRAMLMKCRQVNALTQTQTGCAR